MNCYRKQQQTNVIKMLTNASLNMMLMLMINDRKNSDLTKHSTCLSSTLNKIAKSVLLTNYADILTKYENGCEQLVRVDFFVSCLLKKSCLTFPKPVFFSSYQRTCAANEASRSSASFSLISNSVFSWRAYK